MSIEKVIKKFQGDFKKEHEEKKDIIKKEIKKSISLAGIFDNLKKVYDIIKGDEIPLNTQSFSEDLRYILKIVNKYRSSHPICENGYEISNSLKKLKILYDSRIKELDNQVDEITNCSPHNLNYNDLLRKKREILIFLQEMPNDLVKRLGENCGIDGKTILCKAKKLMDLRGRELTIKEKDLAMIIYALDELREREKEEGYEGGYRSGYNIGFEEGKEKGWSKGQAWGAKSAYEDRGPRWRHR